MSLRHLTVFQRGAHSFESGDAREDGMYPSNTQEGKEWLRGYDEARANSSNKEKDVPSLEQIEARIMFDGERMFLANVKGRVIGTQAGIGVEQAEGEKLFSATVTFVGLKMVKI